MRLRILAEVPSFRTRCLVHYGLFTRNKGETVAGVARLRDVATQGPELWRAQLRQLGSIIN